MQDERCDARESRPGERSSVQLQLRGKRVPTDEKEQRREQQDGIEGEMRREGEEEGGLDGRACAGKGPHQSGVGAVDSRDAPDTAASMASARKRLAKVVLERARVVEMENGWKRYLRALTDGQPTLQSAKEQHGNPHRRNPRSTPPRLALDSRQRTLLSPLSDPRERPCCPQVNRDPRSQAPPPRRPRVAGEGSCEREKEGRSVKRSGGVRVRSACQEQLSLAYCTATHTPSAHERPRTSEDARRVQDESGVATSLRCASLAGMRGSSASAVRSSAPSAPVAAAAAIEFAARHARSLRLDAWRDPAPRSHLSHSFVALAEHTNTLAG